MNAFNNRLLLVWFTFSILMIMALIPIIIWAVRSGQFSNNERARFLPFDENISPELKDSKNVSD